MNFISKKYAPLIFTEFYLLFTILIFWFGPIKYKVLNKFEFIILLFLYHLFFIVGYVISLKTYKSKPVLVHKFSSTKFYILFFFAFLGVLVAYKNNMNANSIIPYNYFAEIWGGINNPGLVYTERMLNIDYASAGESRFFNIIFMFVAFAKFLFIFYFIWYWRVLSILARTFSVLYSFFYISPGISAGVNSVMFWFVIFFSSSLLFFYFLKKRNKLKLILIVLSFLIMVPILSFGYIMSERGGGYSYFEQSSPRGDISITINDIDLESPTIFSYLGYSFTWLDYYITQGYYGFSLVLEQNFRWTYGFGNSAFLQRQFNLISGIDVGQLSYQRRYDNIWGELSQWHSFYGQFANDFSPLGLVLLMFALGFMFARVWMTVLFRDSFYGAALMPIFVIMFVFLPANNQIFGYIDTISYFVFISIFWYMEGKKVVFY